MLKAFQGNKTAQGPFQKGLGLLKSVFKSGILLNLEIASKPANQPSFGLCNFSKK